MAMKMPALRAFVKAHFGDDGAVSLALGGEQRRDKSARGEGRAGSATRVGASHRLRVTSGCISALLYGIQPSWRVQSLQRVAVVWL